MSSHTATWNVFIYNPKTQKTRRRIFRTRRYNANMSEARGVVLEAAKRYGVNDDYVLAIPKKGRILRARKRRSRHRRSR